jgi:hypothetical protein
MKFKIKTIDTIAKVAFGACLVTGGIGVFVEAFLWVFLGCMAVFFACAILTINAETKE